MDPIRIALLTNIEEELSVNSTTNESVFAWELASALVRSAKDTGGISIDVIARKTTATDFPFISVDPSELGEITGDAFHRFACHEAIYTQLLLGGMLNGYSLVHCLAPVLNPILLVAANGVPIVQTIAFDPSHPSAALLPKLIGNRLQQVAIGPYHRQKNTASIPPSVDLTRFRPIDKADDDFIFWPGRRGEITGIEPVSIAASLGLPLYTFEDGNPEEMLKHARLVLYLPAQLLPCDVIWLIRAVACGVPVVSWATPVLTQLFRRPELGTLIAKNDLLLLKEVIKHIVPRNEGISIRREYALGMFGQRSQAARYRDLYKSFFQAD
jgi:hypothetical protein